VEDLSSQLDRAAQGPAGRDPSAAVSAPVAAPAPVSEKEPELASKQEVGHLNGEVCPKTCALNQTQGIQLQCHVVRVERALRCKFH
jgi:hypothetical protein